ncbi:competence/damage-inducible protein A [Ammoniphilus sp. CFH 90114]|uniref:competence/damage-inducible protein A n=1 Tax=Ammoniphilus sp. CFH 90114 TaxID=2493665 RepID=UPI00100FA46B|nr:competence/damage-inducible protein A [Ammoniphilus sp. CFH 90114]RXT15183.1 competence/damage-inducible protein A [Ammoniphilus sp. CFH 90114]
MRAEIIAVGTELLLGQIANTNAQYISKKLAELGVDVLYHSVVGDNTDRLRRVVEAAQSRSQIIIFTGGLGPTKDDLTKETIAKCIHKTLVLDQTAMQRIEEFFIRRGIVMTENNRKQAMVIDGCTVLPNDHGMAPGMAIEAQGLHYILLPGPPRELNPMFDSYGIPYLQTLFPDEQIVHSKVLRFFGIGESALEETLLDLIDNQTNPTIAPLASEGEVTIRLTAKTKTVEIANDMIHQLESIIYSRVGQYVYGYNQDTLESVAFDLLKEKKLTLALAESCTGGLVSRLITSIPGSSEVFVGGVVSYSAEAKELLLDIPSGLINQDGAVSASVAEKMALQVRLKLNADIGLSITGVAGPGQTEEKPVGLVYIGISSAFGEETLELRLSGTREGIQIRAAKNSLFLLIQQLKERNEIN